MHLRDRINNGMIFYEYGHKDPIDRQQEIRDLKVDYSYTFKNTDDAKVIMEEVGEKANLQRGNIFVVGCSTSEVMGAKIGTNSSPEVAKILFDALHDYVCI